MKHFALWLGLLLAAPLQAQEAPTDPNYEAARINVRLAMEYMKQGQLTVAQQKIERALRQYPREVTVQLGAGLLYERLLEPKKAEKHFRAALRADASSPEAQNALGAFLCRSGKWDKGQEMFERAARNPLYPTPAVAYTNAGVCARSAGKLENAEQYLRLALAQSAIYPETFLQLAGVSYDRGNNLQARAFAQRYLAAAPSTPDMLLLAHHIESRLGDQEAAASYAERLRKEFPQSEQVRQLKEFERGDRG